MTSEFTYRQIEVIRLIARGYTYAEMADELGISDRTVKSHADVLRWKLGVKRRREIPQAYARKTGDNPWPNEKDLPR